jgi:hypothetical protein
MQSKLLAARSRDGRKNWDEDENFNGLFGCGNRRAPAVSQMSMEHIVYKMWKHKMLRLGDEPIDSDSSEVNLGYFSEESYNYMILI